MISLTYADQKIGNWKSAIGNETLAPFLTKTRTSRVSAARALVAPAIERSAWRHVLNPPKEGTMFSH
ncbi:MAG TPA: hypothetical protein VKA97_04575, partial [Pyrinomonadaceae bacterium]|nr:hypothetical protein [Pyrinomonadaceae bacterium]